MLSPMAASSSPVATVAHRPRSWRVSLIIEVGLLVVLVGALIYWAVNRNRDTFPAYKIEAPQLSEPLTFLVGALVEVILQPTDKVKGPVSAAAFWVRGEEARQWNAVTAIGTDGKVAMQGVVDAPFGGVEAELAFVVSHTAEAAKPSDCRSPTCQLIRKTVRLVRPTVPAN
jgi:hypothetical protein